MFKTRLSVNINKVALIRNARGSNLPNLTQFALDCERFGAEGITVHPRPDERHVRYQDLYDLKPLLNTEFNVEGYPSKKFLDIVCEVQPTQCTLVPDPPGVLTSNAGWNTIENQAFLKDVIAQLQAANIRVSLFIETEKALLDAAKETGTDRIEFYTGPYAAQFNTNPAEAINPFATASQYAAQIGLGINAGHDLNLKNLSYFNQHLPDLQEVSIGHALVSDALYYGIENTIQLYLRCLENNPS